MTVPSNRDFDETELNWSHNASELIKWIPQ